MAPLYLSNCAGRSRWSRVFCQPSVINKRSHALKPPSPSTASGGAEQVVSPSPVCERRNVADRQRRCWRSRVEALIAIVSQHAIGGAGNGGGGLCGRMAAEVQSDRLSTKWPPRVASSLTGVPSARQRWRASRGRSPAGRRRSSGCSSSRAPSLSTPAVAVAPQARSRRAACIVQPVCDAVEDTAQLRVSPEVHFDIDEPSCRRRAGPVCKDSRRVRRPRQIGEALESVGSMFSLT